MPHEYEITGLVRVRIIVIAKSEHDAWQQALKSDLSDFTLSKIVDIEEIENLGEHYPD